MAFTGSHNWPPSGKIETSNSKIESNIMNFIKSFLLLLFSAFLPLAVQAQQHHEISFLVSSVSSLNVSNKLGVTNLLSTALNVTTNAPGIVWTNSFGVSNNVAAGDTTQFFQDVPLWSDRDGNIPIRFPGYTNGVYDVPISAATVQIDIARGGSGANSAVNFTFVPVCDGTYEATASGVAWIVGVTANTTSRVTVFTNAPLYLWPGCKMLRLKTITNADTDASSQVTVDSVTLNGFVP
jgi:hypothetical protein